MSDMIGGTGLRQSFLQPEQARGDRFVLARTNTRHYGAGGTAPQAPAQGSFGEALMNSLNDVNSAQQTHEQLTVQSIVDPESVNPHDVTVASAKATMTLNITRNVVDRVVQAYRSITTLR